MVHTIVKKWNTWIYRDVDDALRVEKLKYE